MGHDIYMVLEFLARFVWPVAALAFVGWFFWRIAQAVLAMVGMFKRRPERDVAPVSRPADKVQADAEDEWCNAIELPGAVDQPGKITGLESLSLFRDK